MDNIQIFYMTISDLEELKDVLTTDFDDFWSFNILESELVNPLSRLVIAKQNNKIVGFAGIWDGLDQMHITNIVVRKDLRHNGIGTFLLKELITLSKLQNKTELTLEVNESNMAAQKLYLKNGFKILGLRKNYYKNNENALIMSLNL